MTIDNAADGRGVTNGYAAKFNSVRRKRYLQDKKQFNLSSFKRLYVQGCFDHVACLVDAEKQRLFTKQAKQYGLHDLLSKDFWGRER